MFCKNCGSELKGTEMFCTKCGAAVKLPQNLVQTPIPQMGIKPDDTKKTRRVPVKLFVAAGICLLVLITAAATTMYVTSPEYRYRKSVKQAQKQMDGGNYEEALKLYETASGYLPKESEAKEGQIQAKLGTAGAAYQNGEYRSALEIYEAVLSEEENEEAANGRVECYLGLADAAFAANDHEQAKSCYESALRFDKTRAEGYIGLADILLSKEDGVIPAMELLKEGGEFCASGVLEEKRQYIKEHAVKREAEVYLSRYALQNFLIEKKEYDAAGREIKITYYDDRGSAYGWIEKGYDAAGREAKITYCNSDGYCNNWYGKEYDAAGHEVKTTYHGYDDYLYGWIEKEYDVVGRELKITYYDHDGALYGWIEKEYDETGHEVKTTLCHTNHTPVIWWRDKEYDAAGNEVKYTDYYVSSAYRPCQSVINADEFEDEFQLYSYTLTLGIAVEEKMLLYFANRNYYNSNYYDEHLAGNRAEREYDENGNMVKRTVYEAEETGYRTHEYEYQYNEFGDVSEMRRMSDDFLIDYVYRYGYVG